MASAEPAVAADESGAALRDILVTVGQLIVIGLLMGLFRPIVDPVDIGEAITTGIAASIVFGILYLIILIPARQ